MTNWVLTIDLVPYRLTRETARRYRLEGEYWYEKLLPRGEVENEGDWGFYVALDSGCVFYSVTLDHVARQVVFESDGRFKVDDVVDWFSYALDGILEIGHDILTPRGAAA